MEALETYEYDGTVLRLTAFESKPAKTVRAANVRAPGAGRFDIRHLVLSKEGKQLTLTARISGRNIANIYADLLLKDKDLDRFYGPVARHHVLADRSKETHGVVRPDWDDPVELAVVLSPCLRTLTDGVNRAFCFSVPKGYGDPDHLLGGLYTPIGGAVPLRALITFDNSGEMKRLLAYGAQPRSAGPHALTPKEGDEFTPRVQVLTPPASGRDWETTTALTNTLTFRARPLRVVTGPPLPGEYLAGLLVQDLDGGLTREYVPLTISGSDAELSHRAAP